MTIDEMLVSPSFFGEGDYRSLFTRMRREDPVHWTTQKGGRGFWSLFRHADVSRVLDDPKGFSSEREGIMPLLDPEQEEHAKSTYGLGEGVVVIDPPRHAAFRKAISAPFVPKALRDGEPRVKEIIAEIFDGLPDHGEIDLVDDLGAKIPMAVICDVLSIPREDWESLLRWGRMAVGGSDPEFQFGLSAGEAIAEGFGSLNEYAGKLAESRRGCPYSEPLTSLANVEIGGRPLTTSEISFNAGTVILGGFETTRNAFAGGVLALLEHPEQMEKLRADPSVIRHAVEEVIRWSDPVLALMRAATSDTEIGGRKIREGDRVVTWLSSANRDGDAFERPDEFDVTRHPNHHVSFGAGPHFCLGAPLARIELRISLEELIRRYDGIEITGKVERTHTTFVAGLKRMPVRLVKRSTARSDGTAEMRAS